MTQSMRDTCRAPVDKALAGRLTRSIDATLAVDGGKWSYEELENYACTFAVVARSLSCTDVDALAVRLRNSYFHRVGRGGFDADDPEIASMIATLGSADMFDAAAFFCLAVGELQR